MFKYDFFYNNSNDIVKVKQLKMKDLYLLFNFFSMLTERKNKVNFNLFYIYLCTFIMKSNFLKTSPLDLNVLYLYLIFFNKTENVLLINFISSRFFSNKLAFSTKDRLFIRDLLYKKTLNFWKKWKKLKRPKTADSYNEFFLILWKNKITKYNDLGFIKTLKSFYIVNNNTKIEPAVNFSKPLLNSPKYSSSSIHKYIDLKDSVNFEFQFLRKNKVYNKGRYSRCRQNYRTGVYMCLYLSVVSIFGLYYWFYKFSFNFTYLWWLFIVFVGSFFVPKIIKYRLYEPLNLLNKTFDFFRWVLMILKSIFS